MTIELAFLLEISGKSWSFLCFTLVPRCGKIVLHCAVLLYVTSWNTWRNLDTNGGTIRWTDGLILMVTSLRSDLYGMLGRFEGWQVVILLSAFAVHLACTKSRQIHIIFYQWTWGTLSSWMLLFLTAVQFPIKISNGVLCSNSFTSQKLAFTIYHQRHVFPISQNPRARLCIFSSVFYFSNNRGLLYSRSFLSKYMSGTMFLKPSPRWRTG